MTSQTTATALTAPSHNYEVEPLMTMAEAAKRLNIHYWALRRALKRGEVPFYRGFTGRKLVLLSEVRSIVLATSSIGGDHV